MKENILLILVFNKIKIKLSRIVIMIYKYLAMVVYMFILHMNNIGKETFTSKLNSNKISLKIPLMITLIFLLCYLE